MFLVGFWSFVGDMTFYYIDTGKFYFFIVKESTWTSTSILPSIPLNTHTYIYKIVAIHCWSLGQNTTALIWCFVTRLLHINILHIRIHIYTSSHLYKKHIAIEIAQLQFYLTTCHRTCLYRKNNTITFTLENCYIALKNINLYKNNNNNNIYK